MLYLDILSNLVEAFLFWTILRINVGYEKKYASLARFGWIAIAGFTTFANVVKMPTVLFYTLSTSLEFAYAVFLFNHSKSTRFFYAFSLTVFSALCNTLTVLVLTLIDREGLAQALDANMYRVEGVSIYLLALIFCFLLTYLIKPKEVLFKRNHIISMFALLLINTCILIVLLYFILHNAQSIESLLPVEAICIAIVFTTIMIITVFYKTAVTDKRNYDDQVELISLRSEKKRLNQILGTYEFLRKSKHDNAIHLKAIRGMVSKTGSSDAITEYIDNLLNDSATLEFGVYTGNTPVDAIISEAALTASKNDIDFNVVCACPKKLTIPDFELCALIGNLLDNSIEACTKVAHNGYICLSIVLNEGNLKITVKNSSNGQYKKKNNHLITDKTAPEYHGIGIKRINEIVNKYGGMSCFDTQSDYFEAICYLPIREGVQNE